MLEMREVPVTPEELAGILIDNLSHGVGFSEGHVLVKADGFDEWRPNQEAVSIIATALRQAEAAAYERGRAAGRVEEREACAGSFARLVWWGPGYGDGVDVAWFVGKPEALDDPYIKDQITRALEDPSDLFGVEAAPEDGAPGWPMEVICRVEFEKALYDDSDGPRRLVDPGGFAFLREINPPAWVLALNPTTADAIRARSTEGQS